MERLDSEQIRARMSFDVERLRAAATRIEVVDEALNRLRSGLKNRAALLSGEATERVRPEIDGDGLVHIRYAQAQATAELARRATLGNVLAHSSRLSLIACMAISRWIAALRELGAAPSQKAIIKGHIDAGRLAYRCLRVLRSSAKLKSGCGQITSAVVVAEFTHPQDLSFVGREIEEGLYRGLKAQGVHQDADVVSQSSRALRLAAELLENMAAQAEPAATELQERAERVEAEVEAALLRGQNASKGA